MAYDPYLGYDWESPVTETYDYGTEAFVHGALQPLLDIQSEAFDDGYFDYAGFWDTHGDAFEAYDPRRELTRRRGASDTLEGINMQTAADLQDIASGAARTGSVSGNFIKDFEKALRYGEIKASGEHEVSQANIAEFRSDWEDDIYSTWLNLLDLDVFSEESDFYMPGSPPGTEDSAQHEFTPSIEGRFGVEGQEADFYVGYDESVVPDTGGTGGDSGSGTGDDPNIPGAGGGTGGSGGFGLCEEDEHGNCIEYPPGTECQGGQGVWDGTECVSYEEWNECPGGTVWDPELQECVDDGDLGSPVN